MPLQAFHSVVFQPWILPGIMPITLEKLVRSVVPFGGGNAIQKVVSILTIATVLCISKSEEEDSKQE